MRKLVTGIVTVLAGISATMVASQPASADLVGRVYVFSTEFEPGRIYQNPSGCIKLPVFAHVLFNTTNDDVVIYADPFCVTPGLKVAPGRGSHVVPGLGSFKA